MKLFYFIFKLNFHLETVRLQINIISVRSESNVISNET